MDVAVFAVGAFLALLGQGLVLWRERQARRRRGPDDPDADLGGLWTVGPALLVIALVVAVAVDLA